MKCRIMLSAISTALLVVTGTGLAQSTLDTSGIRIWLERADVIRGPEQYGEDNHYNSYKLGTGSFRNFTANVCLNDKKTGPVNGNCTHAVDGSAAWDATAVLPSPSFHQKVVSSDLTAHTPSYA